MKIYDSYKSGSIGMTDSAGYLTTALIPIVQNYLTGREHMGVARIAVGEMFYGCLAEAFDNALSMRGYYLMYLELLIWLAFRQIEQTASNKVPFFTEAFPKVFRVGLSNLPARKILMLLLLLNI